MSHILKNVPFSEHEGGFFPTGGVVSFPDCSKPTFYGTLEHASRMDPLITRLSVARKRMAEMAGKLRRSG
jgi:hypothetical protein